MKIIGLLLVGTALVAQVPTVPNELFPAFRADLNTSLQNAVSITGAYANPSWITSLAYGKITAVPAFATCTGDLGGSAPGCTVAKLNGVSLSGLGTGLLKNMTGVGTPSIAVAADVIALFSACSGTQYLGADGACHNGGGGPGTVTVVSSGSLTSTALVTGGGAQTLQTPAATATLDSGGNVSSPGGASFGVGTSVAGLAASVAGTQPSLIANAWSWIAGTSAPAGGAFYVYPATASTGFMYATNFAGVHTVSHISTSGSGNVCLVTGCTMVTPTLGVASATSLNRLTVTAPATGSTLAVADGKTLTASNTLTFTGTDTSSVAFGTGGTVGYTIASGTSALATAAIGSGACASVVTTTATGTASTDAIEWSFNVDVSAVTGYAPVTTGALIVYRYPTANNVNWKVCNPTSSSITPGAATINWRVVR